jgi:hypothetical protein
MDVEESTGYGLQEVRQGVVTKNGEFGGNGQGEGKVEGSRI